eukprot:Skav233160  [mRNA]  locus=scaffold1669:455578:466520:+ [translate_table: standard]
MNGEWLDQGSSKRRDSKDGNGTISAEELYKFLIGKEYTPLKKVVQEILHEAAAENLERGEGLDFNQFFDFLFIYRQRDGFARKEVDRFRKGFDEYDQDGSGSISTLELCDIFRDFGYRISVETLHHYIDRVDEDGSNQCLGGSRSELGHYKAIFNHYKVCRFRSRQQVAVDQSAPEPQVPKQL